MTHALQQGNGRAGTLPHDRDAERGVLGSMIRDNSVIPHVAEIVAMDDFYADVHQRVFRAILDVWRIHRPVDLVTLADTLKERGQIEDVRYPYLHELWESAPTAANATYHAEIVRKQGQRRSLLLIFQGLADEATHPTGPVEELLDRAQNDLHRIAKCDSRTLEKQVAGNEFPDPVPASALKAADTDREWLWQGYLAPGAVTMLSALWKAGKSTLLAHLLRATAEGGELCGLAVRKSNVLVISEEPDRLWPDRRDALGIQDNVHFMIRPLRVKPSPADWLAFLLHVKGHAERQRYDLVIFDTLGAYWPVIRENDAGEVQAALMPLRLLTELGGSVLLVHHFRKGDGQEATGSRGSGAICGFVDIIVEMRRFQGQNRQDRKRVLTAYGRYSGTPDELVIALSEDGLSYSTHGDRREAREKDLMQSIDCLLPAGDPGMTVDEVLEGWQTEPKPGKRTLAGLLKYGADDGRWRVSGTGKKGDPFRYRREE
jgi:hypothetical protein